ncbi:probable membrane-associated kinase regulator 2 [Elaeis guineensis]|uniref:Probable membrane-associated kinase regulator 2 n=1 Tax=Elaeis guineensis var. tenera TaxID=51953 RepID=A0A6I9QVB4_ELAGV|nr:probable membrane-associated kinase regulator 2 [Elaeis guineensis]
MESFNLLKYWRGGGGAALAAAAAASMQSTAASATTTTVATCVLDPSAETDDEDGGDGDDGPFFDLEFAVPEEDGEGEEEEEGAEEKDGSAVAVEAEVDEEEEEREFNFAVSSEGSCGGDGGLRSDTLSPSDDLFFKGELVPLEPSSIVITSSEADPKPQFAVSLLRSATKLRVFMLGLRKAKSTLVEPNGAPASPTTAVAAEAVVASPKQHSQPQQSRFFIKFKVEEVPIISLFTRDNSSRNSSSSKAAKPQLDSAAPPSSAAAEDKKFSKEVVQKYLNKIKPLYIRVSKRYAEKLRFSGQLTSGGAAAKNEGEETDAEPEVAEPGPPPPAPPAAVAVVATGTSSGVKGQKVNVPAGLKVVCKRLGKSRSASAAVAAVPSPPPKRRDDSLLQLQDGIQSAIAHCKKSFNAAKGSESPLVRSKSDPSDGRSDKSDRAC